MRESFVQQIIRSIAQRIRSLALRQNRRRHVVAVDTLGCEYMGRDRIVERPQHGGAGAYLVGQGRRAELHALAGVA